ncbi:MAG: GIY-YIG nuclease family protein [Legionella sp.]
MLSRYFWVYILLCDNAAYYTGWTNDLHRRYQEHVRGSPKCKYTRSFKPLAIAQAWKTMQGRTTVLQIESYIKSLNKRQKEQLIREPQRLVDLFPDSGLMCLNNQLPSAMVPH